MAGQGPLIPRRRLGTELRVLREAADLRLEDAAAHLDCSTSKISRLENGHGIPRARDVRDLLELYRLDDAKARDRLLRLAGDGRRQGWWQEMHDVVTHNLGQYISLENEASLQRAYGSSYVFALLQTEEYARSLFQAIRPHESEKVVGERMEVRMRRQRELRSRADSPRMRFILDETALRRVVGSRAVMVDQLDHLLRVNENPDWSLRVYPFDAGADVATQCTFVLFTFDSDFDRNAVNLEIGGGDRWLEQAADVQKYSRLFESLEAKSRSVGDSIELIDSIKRHHEENL